MSFRYDWVDKAKGIGILLVIYGHNYPFMESYIYGFHMPLFFFISGMFHSEKMDTNSVTKRAKGILIPYFIWALLLYVFWYFLGRHYGNSVNFNLNPVNNFIGVFYAQGDMQFMDWGIPLWFLPCLFLSFLLFGFINKINNVFIQNIVLVFLIGFGFIYPHYFEFKLPWSFDVACVSLIFYKAGNYLKNKLVALNSNKISFWLIGVLFLCTFLSLLNSKIDMYRSIYGNEALFIITGISGTLFIILLFKKIRFPNVFTFLGKNTIPLLALQLRALTVVKLVLIYIGIQAFNFSEPVKLVLTFVQVLVILPVIFLVNKYLPILNGNIKK